MSQLVLAGSQIYSTVGTGNWWHLQLVFGATGPDRDEIEVQFGGFSSSETSGFNFMPIRSITNIDSDHYGNVAIDAWDEVGIDIGTRDPGDVWELLVNIANQFVRDQPNFFYGLGQNSNSYASCRIALNSALPQSVWRNGSILARNNSGPARPYMARLSVFRRLI